MVNETKITSEDASNGDHFRSEDNHNYSQNEKTCLGYFSRFVTRTLALRLRNTYIYVFPAFFAFFTFYAISCCFQKVRVILPHSTLNFKEKEPWFLTSQ